MAFTAKEITEARNDNLTYTPEETEIAKVLDILKARYTIKGWSFRRDWEKHVQIEADGTYVISYKAFARALTDLTNAIFENALPVT